MFREIIKEIIRECAGVPADLDFSLEVPPRSEYGDYATNMPLILAKQQGENPMNIAEKLAGVLKKKKGVVKEASAVAPGFVNLRLQDSFLLENLGKPMEASPWSGKKIMVEFTDPNPFKEFHIGHLYSNSVGESISRIFEAVGAEVRRANYQGDVGLHVAKAIWGMRRREISPERFAGETLRTRAEVLGEAYAFGAKAFETDENTKQEIVDLNKKIYDFAPEIRDLYSAGRQWSLEYFEEIYKRLGTKFDFYYFESDVGKFGLELVKEYLQKGIFEESNGAVVFPGEKYGLHTRVFITSQGFPTYEAKELGLAPIKYKDFPYDFSFNVTGSEIREYFRVLLVVLGEINPELREKTVHVPHGMVRLPEGKMSSRTGDVIRATDLLDEMKARVLGRMRSLKSEVDDPEAVAEMVAIGAIKYSLLRASVGKDIIFDINASLSLEGDSGPYLQYTNTRLKSILRKYGATIPTVDSSVSLDDDEHRILCALLGFSESLTDAAALHAPNVIAAYLYKLAKQLNGFYHTHPVLGEAENAKKDLRLVLVAHAAEVMERGLGVLGIKSPRQM